ncbi:MAG: hypothetical protein ABSA50_00850 [Candidatus Bathyarchaeia archaeon]
MVAELERRLVELRFIEGIEKVEHVPYPTGDQFWVRFNRPLDFAHLKDLVKKHGYLIVEFAKLPSKLPRGLSEMLWNGVTHVIARKMSGWSKFTSSLGLEPEGIAKIACDLHGQYQIFIATTEEGVELLYEYLGVKYVPPAPPPPVTPAKPPMPATGKSAPVVARPATPAAPVKPPTAGQPSQPTPAQPAPPQPPGAAAKPTTAALIQPKKDPTTQPTS